MKAKLTDWDKRLLEILATGVISKRAAAELGVSMRTVENRLQAIKRITGCRSLFELGWYAAQTLKEETPTRQLNP